MPQQKTNCKERGVSRSRGNGRFTHLVKNTLPRSNVRFTRSTTSAYPLLITNIRHPNYLSSTLGGVSGFVFNGTMHSPARSQAVPKAPQHHSTIQPTATAHRSDNLNRFIRAVCEYHHSVPMHYLLFLMSKFSEISYVQGIPLDVLKDKIRSHKSHSLQLECINLWGVWVKMKGT